MSAAAGERSGRRVIGRHPALLVPLQVRQSVVRTKRMSRDIFPPVAGLHVRSPRGIERIEDAAAVLRCLAADQEQRLVLAVIDEAVADPGTGWNAARSPGTMRCRFPLIHASTSPSTK